MQRIFESGFDIAYLIIAAVFGVLILVRARGRSQYITFGIMTLILAFGDSFHLIPRVMALNSANPDSYAAALGIGKMVTSMTMTVFYLMAFYFLRDEFNLKNCRGWEIAVWVLTIIRIVLCLLPQNEWTSLNPPHEWELIRNVPFVILGGIICWLSYQAAGHNRQSPFQFLWLAILISFGFYILVVLFACRIPVMGMMMIPKTLAYVWMMWMGYRGVSQPEKN